MTPLTRAYLSLGSNLGDRLGNLAGAVRALAAASAPGSDHAVLTIAGTSPVYETAPLGADGKNVPDQPAFLNMIVAVDTVVPAMELRAVTFRVEQQFGRRAGERWQPRPIDIDIVLYGHERIELPGLTVPHPRMAERAFVIRPLVDLDPAIALPDGERLADRLPTLAWQRCELHTSAREFRALVDGVR